MKDIQYIVLKLNNIFTDVEFDIGIEKFGDRDVYKIWVSNLKFYLENKNFKVICKRLKEITDPEYKWFAYHAGQRPE